MTGSELGTVIVTGGAGFIGSALSQKLAPRAERWIVLDSLHPQVHQSGVRPRALHESAELVVGDVTAAETWDELLALAQPNLVIHLAAETGTAQSLHEATRHAQVNVVGTTEMVDAFGRSGRRPSRVLLSSSRAVYGEGTWARADGSTFQPGQRSHAQFEAAEWDFADATPLPSSAGRTAAAPTSVYGATKLAQENILRSWGGSMGVNVDILRLQNVYGPGQSLSNSYTGIVSLFSQLARDGKAIPLYEDGLITRDFVYIDDVADAFVALIESGEVADRPILDVGSGVGTTIQQMAEVVAEYYGSPSPHVVSRYRDGDVRHASCSIDATLDALPWSPQWDLRRGTTALQEWIATEVPTAERARS